MSYFERTYSNNQGHLRHQIKQYGEHFLGWKGVAHTVDDLGASSVFVDTPTAATDFVWQGIGFTKFHRIDFWKKFLTTSDTYIGWLADDNDGFWLDNLTNAALNLILLYVQLKVLCRSLSRQLPSPRCLLMSSLKSPKIRSGLNLILRSWWLGLSTHEGAPCCFRSLPPDR